MAKFDESKVINSLHTDRAKVDKNYYFSDALLDLKEHVETGDISYVGVLTDVYAGDDGDAVPFEKDNYSYWQFLYPYEEPPKKRMTNRQLAEWLAKGNGEYSFPNRTKNFFIFEYDGIYENDKVDENIVIRPWGSDEWVVPTEEVYLRDCK